MVVRFRSSARAKQEQDCEREGSCLSLLAYIDIARSRVLEQVGYIQNPSPTFLVQHAEYFWASWTLDLIVSLGPYSTESCQDSESAELGGPTASIPRAISMSVAPEYLAKS